MNIPQLVIGLAWPVVTLIGLIILGPGKVFERSIGQISSNLLSIKSSADEFKKLTEDFNNRQRVMQESLLMVRQAIADLANTQDVLELIRQNTDQIAVSQGNQEIVKNVDEAEEAASVEMISDLSSQQKLTEISKKWNELTALVRHRDPELYDGRSVGDVARVLTDRRRANWISKHDADSIGALHSQYKRFMRLRDTADDWLTSEIFDNFIRAANKTIDSLQLADVKI